MSAAIADIQIEPGYGNYVRNPVIRRIQVNACFYLC